MSPLSDTMTVEPGVGPITPTHSPRVTITYDDDVVRRFAIASATWGVVAMLAGVLVALQLVVFKANLPPWFTFGRLRPLHTNAAIFAFVGNMLFAGAYHSTQRLVKARMFSDALSSIHFWGWQLIIVAAAITLPLGFTQGKEYAELEWPIDIAIALVWVVFAINFFGTLWRRNEKHLYVAIWFYIATIVTVAVLHIVNSLALPIALNKSYSLFGGAQDALVQWWYGHNAVAFFLTTPILGIMYYYVPKAVERPVFSYRLSIVHFWALIFVYIWAGPHHLLNTALPDWAQTLGMVFSIMLWAPSWGGMINGLFTMRGAWDKVRADPVLKFFAAALTFYGMATFEGPLLSIKSVSSLGHYTDWIIGHVHGGALGWNGFMAAGMLYWMVPRLYGVQLYSKRLADAHFWIGTLGILLYMVSMWVAGVTQGMMWRATDASGALAYPSFVETVVALRPMYWSRLLGGLLYLSGFIMLGYNIVATVRSGKPVHVTIQVAPPEQPAATEPTSWRLALGRPVIVATICLVLLGLTAKTDGVGALSMMLLSTIIAFGAMFVATLTRRPGEPAWHRLIEGRGLLFTVLTAIAVLIGGVAELIPAIVIRPAEGSPPASQAYTALELHGRDLYVREGCYVCHSQMIRPFRFETNRYGAFSTLSESAFDHPFQWGSKRTGPDLARIGGRYPNLWHFEHMKNPRTVSPESIMPAYPHLFTSVVDHSTSADRVRAMRALGVPYTADQVTQAEQDARRQAAQIAADLEQAGVKASPDTEIIALTAYLQRLGRAAPSGPAAAEKPVAHAAPLSPLPSPTAVPPPAVPPRSPPSAPDAR